MVSIHSSSVSPAAGSLDFGQATQPGAGASPLDLDQPHDSRGAASLGHTQGDGTDPHFLVAQHVVGRTLINFGKPDPDAPEHDPIKADWKSVTSKTYSDADAAAIAGARSIVEHGYPDQIEYAFEMERNQGQSRSLDIGPINISLGSSEPTWRVGDLAFGNSIGVMPFDSITEPSQDGAGRVQTTFHSHPDVLEEGFVGLSPADLKMLFATDPVDGKRTTYLYEDSVGRLFRIEADADLEPPGVLNENYDPDGQEPTSAMLKAERDWVQRQVDEGRIRVSELAVIDESKKDMKVDHFDLFTPVAPPVSIDSADFR